MNELVTKADLYAALERQLTRLTLMLGGDQVAVVAALFVVIKLR